MSKETCPKCGGTDLYADGTCQTWPNGNGGWMSCQGCWSAMYFACANDTCDWRYTHGLNPDNPRAVVNEKNRPTWIPEYPYDDETEDINPESWVPETWTWNKRAFYSEGWVF